MSNFRKELFPMLIWRTILYLLLAIFLIGSAIFISIVVIAITPVLIIIAFFYLYLVYLGVYSKYRLLFILYKVYLLEKTDKERALQILDSEIYDCKELLNVEKSEMDTHRLNTRDEADAMRYSKRGEREVRSILGVLERLQRILVASMKKEPSSQYDIDLDKY